MPEVSVIIPVYNSGEHLKECLDSIANQTLADIEIICVDDGSTDTSYDILNEYAYQDKRFVILRQENKGAAVARNWGIDISRGEYLSFLDSDDVFAPTMLEMAVEKSKKFDTDIVIYKAFSFNTNTKKTVSLNDNFIQYKKYFNEPFSVNDVPDIIFNSFLVPAWNKMFKKRFIINENIRFQNVKRSNDIYFTNTALVLAKKILLMDDFLVYYRTGFSGNLQSGNDKTPLEFYKALVALKELLNRKKIYYIVEKSFVKLAIELIFYNLNSLKTDSARKLVITTLRKEGFRILGISEYKNLLELTFLGYLQYKLVCITDNGCITKSTYGLYKIWQYYQFTGLRNTVKKIIMKSK